MKPRNGTAEDQDGVRRSMPLASLDGEAGAGPQESGTGDVRSAGLNADVADMKLQAEAREDFAEVERAEKAVDRQTSLVVSMLVGDPRAPGERNLLDQLHDTELAAKRRARFHDRAKMIVAPGEHLATAALKAAE